MTKQTNLWHPSNSQTIWQISGGASSWKIAAIGNTAEKIKWVLDWDNQQLVANNQIRLNELLTLLNQEAINIKQKLSYDYDVNNYTLKLLQDSDYLHSVFTKLLSENNQLQNIYKELDELVRTLPNWELIKNLAYKFYLEDLVYDYFSINDLLHYNVNDWQWFKSIDDIYAFVLKQASEWSTCLDLWSELKGNEFFHYLNTGHIFKLIKIIGESWIKTVRLCYNDLYLFFQKKPYLLRNFIELAWKSGIKCLNLNWNNLQELFTWTFNDYHELLITANDNWIEQLIFWDVFNYNSFSTDIDSYIESAIYQSNLNIKEITLDNGLLSKYFEFRTHEQFIDFISTICSNWVKSLDFNWDSFYKLFISNWTSSIQDFIKIVWNNWIVNLGLYWCNLNLIFGSDFNSFLEFIKIICESKIEFLHLGFNHLWHICNNEPELFFEFIKTTWASWIKHLNLRNNGLSDIFDGDIDLILEFLNIIWESGIKYLNIEDNQLLWKISDSWDIKRIEELIKELKTNKWIIIILLND